MHKSAGVTQDGVNASSAKWSGCSSYALVLDGVYVKGETGEGLRFLRLPRPSDDDVYEVAMRTAKKVQAKLEKRVGTSDSESNGEVVGAIEPALGACYDLAARAPKKVIVDGHRMGKGEIVVVVDGYNVYAGDAIDGREWSECVGIWRARR